MYSCSLTQRYKTAFIHSHYQGRKLVVTINLDSKILPAKSIHAAKILITRFLKEKENRWIVTDDIYIYGYGLSKTEAEHQLGRELASGNVDAYLTKLNCSCGSEDVEPALDDNHQPTHFCCQYCGNIVDDHKYDRKSFL